MESFDIYFSGQLLADASPEKARAAIGKMFRLEGPKLERLFSGKPARIKSGVDIDKASSYREAFRKAGALIDIVPAGAPAPQPAASEPEPEPAPVTTEQNALFSAAGNEMELLPPRTGTLEDYAPQVEAQDIANIDWMQLDAPGITLDDTPRPTAYEIDTQGISMSQPDEFSLEDCVSRPDPKGIPDTSHLSLMDND